MLDGLCLMAPQRFSPFDFGMVWMFLIFFPNGFNQRVLELKSRKIKRIFWYCEFGVAEKIKMAFQKTAFSFFCRETSFFFQEKLKFI